MPGSPEDDGDTVDGDLPGSVREMVAAVQARVRESPGVPEIRALAAQKAAQAAGDPLTLSQIRELADAAVSRAERVTVLMARLVELTGSGHARS